MPTAVNRFTFFAHQLIITLLVTEYNNRLFKERIIAAIQNAPTCVLSEYGPIYYNEDS